MKNMDEQWDMQSDLLAHLLRYARTLSVTWQEGNSTQPDTRLVVTHETRYPTLTLRQKGFLASIEMIGNRKCATLLASGTIMSYFSKQTYQKFKCILQGLSSCRVVGYRCLLLWYMHISILLCQLVSACISAQRLRSAILDELPLSLIPCMRLEMIW